MDATSLLLVLGSAGLHAALHVALKRARDRTAFIWWMWLWAAVLFCPVLVLNWQSVPPVVWGLMAVSAVFEALYHLAIARAYRSGDLSVVYPLARGSAPLFLAGWAALLLQERPSPGGAGGILLIVAGLSCVNLPRPAAWREGLRSFGRSASRWALAAGLCISLYTLLDQVAVRQTDALLYTYLTMALTLLWLTPGTLAAVGWAGLRAEWRSSRWVSAFAGCASLSAYALVLSVMRAGVPASYVASTREVSVVFGAVAGVVFLGESGSAMRVLGSSLVAAGVAAVAVLG
jgi:drug/metabolite transporter (DMT)-like permease